MSQAEYARRRQWSRQRVNKLVKDGKIPTHDGRIDPVEADASIAAARHGSYDGNGKGLPLGLPVTKGPAVLLDGGNSVAANPSGEALDLTTDEAAVQQIYDHLKGLIFNGRSMTDVPHVEIKKLHEFIGAVQKKRELEMEAKTLILVHDAQDKFVQVSGQLREGFLNVADRVSGATAARALELLRARLPVESHKALEDILQGKQWEDLFHSSIKKEITEVLRALVDANLLRES